VRPENARTLAVIMLMTIPLWGLASVRLWMLIRRPRRAETMELASVVWIFTWIAYVIAQGNLFPHYVVAIVIPMMVLAVGAGATIGRDTTRLGSMARAGLAVAATFVVFLGIATDPGPRRDPAIVAALDAIEDRTTANERIFVWGNEPFLYVSGQRTPAGPYAFLFPLTAPGYSTPTQIARLLSDWVSSPPELIVDASINPMGVSAFPLLGVWTFPGNQPPDHLEPLREFVRQRYLPIETDGPWPIYVLR
jgi:hypothetical protein